MGETPCRVPDADYSDHHLTNKSPGFGRGKDLTMNRTSLITLWNLTQKHPGTSGARAAAGVLLGLYNGERFPFDLTDLRVLDPEYRAAALDVITADATRCQMEVHEWLNHFTGRHDFGCRFEHLAHEYKCFQRGRCSKAHLAERPVDPPHITFRMPDEQTTLQKAA